MLRLGRLSEAAADYQELLEIKPDDPSVHYNLGNVLLRLGRLDEAMAQYQKALELKPDDPKAGYNLGVVLARLGRLDEAAAQYQRVLRIKPDYAKARSGLDAVLLRRDQLDDAVRRYRRELKTHPEAVEPRNNLAWLRATCPEASLRDGAEAVELAQRAVELSRGQRRSCSTHWPPPTPKRASFPKPSLPREALDQATQQKKRALADGLRAASRCMRPECPFGKRNGSFLLTCSDPESSGQSFRPPTRGRWSGRLVEPGDAECRRP